MIIMDSNLWHRWCVFVYVQGVILVAGFSLFFFMLENVILEYKKTYERKTPSSEHL